MLIAYLWFQSWSAKERGFFYYVFEQSDLFTPVAETKLDLTQQGAKVRFHLNPRYEGPYSLELVMPEQEFGTRQAQNGLIRGALLCNNVEDHSICSPDHYSLIWPGNNITLFVLASFNITKDHLKCKDLELELEVIKPYSIQGLSSPASLQVTMDFSL